MTLVVIILVFVLLLIAAGLATRAKNKALQAAQPGTRRIETVKAHAVNRTVSQYRQARWTIVEQTSSKSLGSQARVTITFEKR